jgi:hypothetical protein
MTVPGAYRPLRTCAGNILLTADAGAPHGFAAKVADFGLARSLDLHSRIETRTYGTVTHMPHELLCSGIMSKARARLNHPRERKP